MVVTSADRKCRNCLSDNFGYTLVYICNNCDVIFQDINGIIGKKVDVVGKKK